ncbi:DUF2271 domain-containing protein [Zhongshania aquimaris]|uniref:DUF2271 domain-containing protein n=1 Tax=Zhongshania aquimaris TaxID=2857107 RepID=A0ABS6VQB3_9GAMM|nr:DUF2271 domain-containing protein [Zhongshania aquimaris]MBW2939955.1 DUF2271 domain-containing protein [Zhongshania aquimaris]
MIKKMTAMGLVGMAMTVSAQAGDMALSLELPRIDVAEYHRPYVAMWLQNDDSGDVTNLAVWYQLDKRDDKGEQWLKDMRQWWRRSGRSASMPLDGVSGATQQPGVHSVDLAKVADSLAPGSYKLYVEAAREVGGRELLKIPFQWPVTSSTTLETEGKTELGKILLNLAP